MDISSWLNHRCTIAHRTGWGPKRTPIFGAQSGFDARVEKRVALVRSASGDMVTSSYVLMTDVLVLPDDRIWFPSIAGEPPDDVDNMNAAHTPLSVETATDKLGETYVRRVYF